MKKYLNFNFEKYLFDEKTLKWYFYYNFDDEIFFEEIIDFDDKNFEIKNKNKEIIDNLMFHLHLALWVSYYKFYFSDNLVIKTKKIDDEDISFWKKFYINWLWEFLFVNKLKIENKFNFIIDSKIKSKKIEFETQNKSLVAIWWWKDSIVSIELLKKMWEDFDLFTFSSKDNILYQNTTKISEKKRLYIKRELSKNIKEIIDSWRYNWHVPITWIIAFVSFLSAYLYGYKYIVLSNEFSANYHNTFYEWIYINHQYSKSLEFELDLKEYVNKNISSQLEYFSILRGFYEINIAYLFSLIAKKYFSYFSSCNSNFKILEKKENIENKYWCLSCPKCVFVYIILRPFITKEENNQIFKRELLEDITLKNLFLELAWLSWIKPFECVWTQEEVLLSISMILEKNEIKSDICDIFKKYLEDEKIKKELENHKKNYFSLQKNNIPKYFLTKINNLLWEKK